MSRGYISGLLHAPWQTIDTAPKDGRWLWGFEPYLLGSEFPEQMQIRWLDEHPHQHRGVTVRQAGWYTDGFDRDRPVGPTYWREFAPPPLIRVEAAGNVG